MRKIGQIKYVCMCHYSARRASNSGLVVTESASAKMYRASDCSLADSRRLLLLSKADGRAFFYICLVGREARFLRNCMYIANDPFPSKETGIKNGASLPERHCSQTVLITPCSAGSPDPHFPDLEEADLRQVEHVSLLSALNSHIRKTKLLP